MTPRGRGDFRTAGQSRKAAAYHAPVPSDLFLPGHHAVYRGVHTDDSGLTGGPVVADLKPVVIAEHSASTLRLFTPAGSRTLLSRPVPAGRPKPWGPGEWELVDASWDRWNALFHHVAGEWRATWLLWSPAWEFLGWYVNLQEPLWQTRWGFDFRDLQLDIVVGPDRRWRWKDEDDLRRSLATGLISAGTEVGLRESAAAAVRAIATASPPFDDAASVWRPDSAWLPPALPDGEARDALLQWTASDALGRYE